MTRMTSKNCKVTETTVNGTITAGTFGSPEKAQEFLMKKAAVIREASTGERYSYAVTDEGRGYLTVGVIGGNPEAIRYETV